MVGAAVAAEGAAEAAKESLGRLSDELKGVVEERAKDEAVTSYLESLPSSPAFFFFCPCLRVSFGDEGRRQAQAAKEETARELTKAQAEFARSCILNRDKIPCARFAAASKRSSSFISALDCHSVP